MKKLLQNIVAHPEIHAKWLNTLSFLENCGARKIAACEHPTLVREEMLKHAAEEFRHAHYLKRQISKITSTPFPSYAPPLILGGFATLHYLQALDIATCRLLQNKKRELAYFLVTYAIEVRAHSLYPIYHKLLRAAGSDVHVKSIILEEEEHLEEMRLGLKKHPEGLELATRVCTLEESLHAKWIQSIGKTFHKKSFYGKSAEEQGEVVKNESQKTDPSD